MSDAPVQLDPSLLPDPLLPDAPGTRGTPGPPGLSDALGSPGPSGGPTRPLPPRSWRDRLGDLAVAAPTPGRVATALGALVVAAMIGWRTLAPPPPPPEMAIPFAEQTAPAGQAGPPGGGAGGGGGDGAPVVDGAAASPGTAAGAPGGPAAGNGTAGEVVVHVVGAVASPGVQRLPAGARVVDAVEAAGGATPDADLGRINLAAPLSDGQQVYVLRVGEQAPAPAPGGGTAGPDGADGGPVNINTASASQLEELPGVGPTTAEAIIAHRDQHGPFGSVDDLIDVRGIGEAKLEQIRPLATV